MSEQIKHWSKTLKTVLNFVGAVLALLGVILYMVIVNIMLTGFKIKMEWENMLSFLIIGGIAGVFINMAFLIQGLDLAKMIPEVNKIRVEYRELTVIAKDKWLMPLWLYTVKTFLINVIFKVGSIMIMSYYLLDISITGLTDDVNVINKYKELAFSNVILFIGLGLMGMAGAYNYYIENKVPLIQREINQIKENGRSKQDELLRKIKRNGERGLRQSCGTGTDRQTQESVRHDSSSGTRELGVNGATTETSERIEKVEDER